MRSPTTYGKATVIDTSGAHPSVQLTPGKPCLATFVERLLTLVSDPAANYGIFRAALNIKDVRSAF
ncbi:hypothetical protein M404DRAFT_17708 [Pisolithus tinctorius Marx 270]|uniref:Uncharacterized protein n=1 Tax=Pisolithus tinctorius Marx 270 TaxID=870435 RepID=A0A0C3PKT6_PISTI|nr:hypothetical protein M404DRAFT_17708 [Pisolithus tinctorius Marx 270]